MQLQRSIGEQDLNVKNIAQTYIEIIQLTKKRSDAYQHIVGYLIVSAVLYATQFLLYSVEIQPLHVLYVINWVLLFFILFFMAQIYSQYQCLFNAVLQRFNKSQFKSFSTNTSTVIINSNILKPKKDFNSSMDVNFENSRSSFNWLLYNLIMQPCHFTTWTIRISYPMIAKTIILLIANHAISSIFVSNDIK